MFRNLRRGKQQLSEQDCFDVLARGEWGTLGLLGDDGYPYTVPLNYVFHNGKVYFHSAKQGHKLDALKRNDKASFCVVTKSDLVPERITTYFESVIVFGRIRVLDDADTAIEALTALTMALSGDADEAALRDEIERCRLRDNVAMLELTVEHISGKRAIELVRMACRMSGS